MSTKNQAAESRLMDESEVEQRAMIMARDEGRSLPTADDRARAREELQAPGGVRSTPEISPELGGDRAAADDVPDESGRRVPDLVPEDKKTIGKELVEKGMTGPVVHSRGDDQRRK